MKRRVAGLLCLVLAGTLFAAGPARKICCVGNSITAITGYPTTLNNYLKRDTVNYTWSVVNEGVSSTTMLRKGNYPYWTVTGGTGFANVFTQQPAIITIELGTNDCKSYNWDTLNQYFIADYEAMIDTFSRIASHPQVYVVLPTPLFQPDTGEIRDSCLQAELPRLWQIASDKGVPVIDAHTMLLPYSNYFSDGIHPTLGGGADSIASVYYRALTGRSTHGADTLTRAPLMIVSDTLKKFVVSIGQTGTTAEQTLYIANPCSATIPLDTVTVTGSAAWLTPRLIDKTNHMQRVGLSVNCALVPQTAQVINDTITLASALARPATKKIVVRLTVRQTPVFSNFVLYATPDTTLILPRTQRTFKTVSYNQYGEVMGAQPVFIWSASAGSIVNGVFTAPSAAGLSTVQASANGITRTCLAVVTSQVSLLPPGNVGQLMILQNVANGSYAIAPKGTRAPCDSNYFSAPESTVVPMPESLVTIGSASYKWHLLSKNNLKWFDSSSANNSIGIAAMYVYTPCARTISLVQRNYWQLWMKLNNKVTIKSDTSTWGFDTVWDHSIYSVKLKKGMNLCLFKLWAKTGSKFFTLRFSDSLNTMSLPDIAFQFTPTPPQIPGITGIAHSPVASRHEAVAMRRTPQGGLKVAVPYPGRTTIGLFTINGRCMATAALDEAGDCTFTKKQLGPNVYLVKVINAKRGTFCKVFADIGR